MPTPAETMMSIRPYRRGLAVAFVVLIASVPLAQGDPAAQDPGTPAPGSREAMWPAPTEADWARPCLITWQRTFEDAISVSLETGRPILVCVNMDGEIASEHYAGIRYRDPAIAALYQPYIAVIASVYRHTPRDFDNEGRRIPCPRFGTVTCGEHIDIEPGLFDQYFEGQRVAPRHIMVELDGAETYDVYYAFDTASVFERIRRGIAERPTPPPPTPDERNVVERVTSRAALDREAVETAYVQGDRTVRRKLVQAALAGADAEPVGLLRLAIYDLDVELNRLARAALAGTSSPGAIDLILEALRVPMDEAEREALIVALERIGEASDRARTLAAVHRGLATRSSAVDVERWTKALEGAEVRVATELTVLESRLEYQAEASVLRPEDAETSLELAEASLSFAVDPKTTSVLGADPGTAAKYASLHFEDAYRAARRAEDLGANGWRVDAAIGVAAWYLGRTDEAYERAETAVRELEPGSESWTAMAALELFADKRQRAIRKAVRQGQEWPKEWITDVHSAYGVLAGHPFGTADQVARHYDFLRWFGAPGQASAALDAGLARHPDSWPLHERLRGRVLHESGAAGLEDLYADMLRGVDGSPNLEWYAGYASIVAAEFHRRAGDAAAAALSYDRAIAYFDRGAARNPDSKASADHYAALALAGRARLALEAADWERAVREVLASFERRMEAAATLDGLGISPVGTAQMLRSRLADAGEVALAGTVQAALDALDPELLELPAFERGGRPSPDARGR